MNTLPAKRHIGLIGGGNITRTHALAARAVSGLQIAAIFGANAGKTAALAEEFGATAYADLDAFLAHRPMDLVAIGSPSGLHADQGIAAARRGLHVLTEKPIDVSTVKTDLLIKEVRRAGVKLGVFFQDRFKPEIKRLKALMDRKALGKVILADARVKWYRPPAYYADSKWRGTLALDGGAALINQGIHTLDLLLWLVGDVASVDAQKTTALHRIEGEDTLTALLEFRNGALGVFVAATSICPGYPRRIEISGAQGTVILEHDGIIAMDMRDAAKEGAQRTAAEAGQNASSAAVADAGAHQAVIEDFLNAIDTDREPACSGAEARKSLAVTEAIYESCRARRRVAVR